MVRPNWFPKVDGKDANLTEFCQLLHEDHTGSGIRLSEDMAVAYMAGLRWALANWEQSIDDAEGYDNAVKGLIIATLTERGEPLRV